MPLRRIVLLSVPLLAAALVAGCTADLETEPAEQTATHALEGDWSVRAFEDAHTCPEFGEMAPVGPGVVSVSRDLDGWVLSPRRSGQPVRYTATGENLWSRAVSGPYEGCQLEADASWVFDAVTEARFTSRYSASFRVFGDACGYPQDRCEVSYTVIGARR